MSHATRAGALALAALALVLAGCSSPAPQPQVAQQWPEADALFRQDPRWLGGDAAFSVPLNDGRILWLFGDTFVSTGALNVRGKSKMVRNTVGVQRGSDPARASMAMHWRGTAEAPASFFPEDGEVWHWPGHGLRLGAALVLFFQRVRATGTGGAFGFEAVGWSVGIVDDASGEPPSWTVRLVPATAAPPGIAVGSAVNLVDGYVVALGHREPGDHAGFLTRWTPADLLAGKLEAAEWWLAGRGWVKQAELAGASPSVALANAGPESSLHLDAARGRWVHVRSEGFGATTIVVSEAAAIEGPWSEPKVAFRPPESDRADTLVYAAKAHPELDAQGALAVTYATNTTDFGALLRDTTIYYPRFVRLPK